MIVIIRRPVLLLQRRLMLLILPELIFKFSLTARRFAHLKF